MIGSLPVTFDGHGDDRFVDGERYEGTPSLWELMVMKHPGDFDVEVLNTYGDILQASNAKSKSRKWKEIVSYLFKQNKYGSGIPTVFLPTCFVQLLDRLDLRDATYQDRNNGVRNEIVGGRGLFDTIASLAGRVLTSSTSKTLGSKAVSVASNAALKGVEKDASKPEDHVVRRVTRKKTPPAPHTKSKRTSQQQDRLNNLISGSGIATIYNFVQRYR